jgi:acyl transferase domain-containing protein
MERALAVCDAEGVAATPLQTSHAFHSVCIEPMLDPLERAAAQLPPTKPRLGFASTLEGRLLPDGEAIDARYWRRHAREPVRFLEAAQALGADGVELVVELGPHATLTRIGERCLPPGSARWLPSLMRGTDGRAVMMETAIELWVAGVDVDLARATADLGWRCANLTPARSLP